MGIEDIAQTIWMLLIDVMIRIVCDCVVGCICAGIIVCGIVGVIVVLGIIISITVVISSIAVCSIISTAVICTIVGGVVRVIVVSGVIIIIIISTVVTISLQPHYERRCLPHDIPIVVTIILPEHKSGLPSKLFISSFRPFIEFSWLILFYEPSVRNILFPCWLP